MTACLFLSVAVLIRLGTITGHWLWLIVPPLWFAPIIMSDIRVGARRADSLRSGANSFIDDMVKVIGIMFLIIVISIFSAIFIGEESNPFVGVKFDEAAKGSSSDASGFPNEQPVLPAHSLGDQ